MNSCIYYYYYYDYCSFIYKKNYKKKIAQVNIANNLKFKRKIEKIRIKFNSTSNNTFT